MATQNFATPQDKCYDLYMDEFLSSKELSALFEVLISTRVFSKIELLAIVDKLKKFTAVEDRQLIATLIDKELYHYSEVKHDCNSLQDILWKLVNNIRVNAKSASIIIGLTVILLHTASALRP